jgi:hypothetical protein
LIFQVKFKEFDSHSGTQIPENALIGISLQKIYKKIRDRKAKQKTDPMLIQAIPDDDHYIK